MKDKRKHQLTQRLKEYMRNLLARFELSDWLISLICSGCGFSSLRLCVFAAWREFLRWRELCTSMISRKGTTNWRLLAEPKRSKQLRSFVLPLRHEVIGLRDLPSSSGSRQAAKAQSLCGHHRRYGSWMQRFGSFGHPAGLLPTVSQFASQHGPPICDCLLSRS